MLNVFTKKSIILICIVILLIAMSGIIYAVRFPLIKQLTVYKLLPRPEAFTELYFDNHRSLPALLSDAPQSFRFVIHNNEYKNFKYIYEVTVIDGNQTRLIDKGVVQLSQNAQKTVNETVITSTISAQQQQVMVRIINKRQFINFWVKKALL